jgi:hypothetical protein
MQTVKKSIMAIAMMAMYTLSYAQSSSFKSFVDVFPPRSYPFNLSYYFDRDAQTPFEPPPDIPKDLYTMYILQQGIWQSRKENSICFWGCLAKGKFKTSENYYLFLISVDGDAGCDIEEYLVTFSSTGKIIDTLFVFGEGHMLPVNGEHVVFSQDAFIDSISIVIKREEQLGESEKQADGRFKYKRKVYDKIYHISKDGIFIKDKEEWKDDVRYWNP